MDKAVWINAALWGLAAGAVCGLVPFLFALTRRLKWWALASLFTCSVCGVILGAILALPVAISFTVAIAIAGTSVTQIAVANRPASNQEDGASAPATGVSGTGKSKPQN
ncbi:MAG: hypothetical protein WA885_00575 [Phormidesmis sp.]